MTPVEFNWTPMIQAYSNGGAFAAVIDYLASRQRDPRKRETKVGNLTTDLALRGHQFQFADLEAALRVFQEAGCGSYHRGRPLENSRLEWGVSAREISQGVLAKLQDDIQDQPPPSVGSANGFEERNGKSAVPTPSVPMETYHFPVRRGVVMEFRIRSDMTAAEINNLAEFVRIIAASRSSEAGDS